MSYFEPDQDLLAASDKALKSVNVSRLLKAAKTFDVKDPATEEVIAEVPDASQVDLDAVVDAGQFISNHLGRKAASRAGNAIAARRATEAAR